jgi:hypothetical protein
MFNHYRYTGSPAEHARAFQRALGGVAHCLAVATTTQRLDRAHFSRSGAIQLPTAILVSTHPPTVVGSQLVDFLQTLVIACVGILKK